MKAPILRFSPTAWSKLLYLRDLGPTEIGAFGITEPDDHLLVVDLVMVSQATSAVSVAFEDAAVADFFDAQVDLGRRPEQFGRIWLHTHPGNCALPSHTDEETFDRVYGRTDWALMFILARGGQSYARLRFNVGPGGSLQIHSQVEWRRPFAGSDFDAWQREYAQNVRSIQASFYLDPLKPARLTRRAQRSTTRASELFDRDFDLTPIDETPPTHPYLES